MRIHRAAAAFVIAAACGSDTRLPAIEESTPPPPSDNPIDVAVWPRLVAAELTELPEASSAELCRRMAIDLIGIVPSAEERATLCEGKTAEEMARGFIAHPRFLEIERRFWIRRLGADPIAMMADHIVDADRILDAAATGAIGYDDLVARLVAHPIVTINRPVAAADDVVPTIRFVFETFLGRSPSLAEIDDFSNLLRPWRRRFEDRYDLGYGYYVRPAALDPGVCNDPVFGAAACTSTLLGTPTTLQIAIAPSVPAGYSQTSASLFYYETVHGNVPAALQAELEKPGRLLATRAELWDEAADFALARFLGWWRSSANEPETVLPEVRRALAQHFRALPVRDLRELYVTVVTSLLYTTSAGVDIDDTRERPPWATGPSKLLEPEQLLDSVDRALDRPMVACDPHTDEERGREHYWPSRLRAPATSGEDLYRQLARQLGGCLGAVQPPRHPGLPALLAHIDIGRRFCGAPPVAEGAGYAEVADQLFLGFLARLPSESERAHVDAAAAACSADPDCGSPSAFASELCGALLRSTTFLYY